MFSVNNFTLIYDTQLVHLLVCNVQGIFKMHGATIKIMWVGSRTPILHSVVVSVDAELTFSGLLYCLVTLTSINKQINNK